MDNIKTRKCQNCKEIKEEESNFKKLDTGFYSAFCNYCNSRKEKKCYICEKVKNLEEFGTRKTKKGGRIPNSYCFSCRNNSEKQKYKENSLERRKKANEKREEKETIRKHPYREEVKKALIENGCWNNTLIAKKIGCSFTYVRNLREELESKGEIEFQKKLLTEKGTFRRRLIQARAQHTRKEIVYFIQTITELKNNPIKIGTTKNLHKRLGKFNTDSPFELKVLGVIEGGTKKETELHILFDHLRIKGEWFRPENELINWIENNTHENLTNIPNGVKEIFKEIETEKKTGKIWKKYYISKKQQPGYVNPNKKKGLLNE